MDRPGLRLGASAAPKAALAIAGLLGGLIIGLAWMAVSGAAGLDAIRIVAKGATVGSFLGVGAALVAATGGRSNMKTIPGLAWLIAEAAIILVFWKAIS